MSAITCNPYLFFDGNCREAMTYYQGVFGGELRLMTFGEMDHSCPDALKDSISHAFLSGGDIILMASDNPAGQVPAGGNVHLALGGSQEKKLTAIFDRLAADGKVGQKLSRQSWGDVYGDLTDKYGFHWMVNISAVNP